MGCHDAESKLVKDRRPLSPLFGCWSAAGAGRAEEDGMSRRGIQVGYAIYAAKHLAFKLPRSRYILYNKPTSKKKARKHASIGCAFVAIMSFLRCWRYPNPFAPPAEMCCLQRSQPHQLRSVRGVHRRSKVCPFDETCEAVSLCSLACQWLVGEAPLHRWILRHGAPEGARQVSRRVCEYPIYLWPRRPGEKSRCSRAKAFPLFDEGQEQDGPTACSKGDL